MQLTPLTEDNFKKFQFQQTAGTGNAHYKPTKLDAQTLKDDQFSPDESFSSHKSTDTFGVATSHTTKLTPRSKKLIPMSPIGLGERSKLDTVRDSLQLTPTRLRSETSESPSIVLSPPDMKGYPVYQSTFENPDDHWASSPEGQSTPGPSVPKERPVRKENMDIVEEDEEVNEGLELVGAETNEDMEIAPSESSSLSVSSEVPDAMEFNNDHQADNIEPDLFGPISNSEEPDAMEFDINVNHNTNIELDHFQTSSEQSSSGLVRRKNYPSPNNNRLLGLADISLLLRDVPDDKNAPKPTFEEAILALQTHIPRGMPLSSKDSNALLHKNQPVQPANKWDDEAAAWRPRGAAGTILAQRSNEQQKRFGFYETEVDASTPRERRTSRQQKRRAWCEPESATMATRARLEELEIDQLERSMATKSSLVDSIDSDEPSGNEPITTVDQDMVTANGDATFESTTSPPGGSQVENDQITTTTTDQDMVMADGFNDKSKVPNMSSIIVQSKGAIGSRARHCRRYYPDVNNSSMNDIDELQANDSMYDIGLKKSS